eukprot:CFRG7560T1
MQSAWQRDTESVIDFSIGQPSKDLLPIDLLNEAVNDVTKRCHENTMDVRDVLQYGDNRGQQQVLCSIAKWLTIQYGSPVLPESLFLTNGSSSALEIVCACLTMPGDFVLVEDPTYFLAMSVFKDHGLNCIAVPSDHNGLDLFALEVILMKKRKPKFVYTIPTFGNPTSSTMPGPARKKFAELLEKYDLLAVTDDVYQLLHFPSQEAVSSEPPQLMAVYCPDRCISLGSFSKILAPGLRFGWIQGPHSVLARLENRGFVNSGGGLHPFAGAIIYSLIETGKLDKHLAQVRDTLSERKRAMCHALKSGLSGSNCTFAEENGGYFVWLVAPERDLTELLPECLSAGVAYTPGSKTSVEGTAHKDCARLSFAYYDIPQLIDGVERLCRMLNNNN